MVPVQIARAIKLAGSHPAVTSYRIVDESAAGDVTILLEIKTELPAQWRQAGESPSGVREIEPIKLAFPSLYPLAAPMLTLRQDFNRRHPHINPGPPDEPPVPCVVAGSPRELIQSHGIEGLVDQLADWLDKASTVDLINPAQGWEPVRRDNLDDVMVADGAALRGLADLTGGSLLAQIDFTYVDGPDRQIYLIDHRSLAPTTFQSAKWARSEVEPGRYIGKSFGMVFWPGERSPGVPFIVGDYAPETVTSMGGLRQRAKDYGCNAQFDALVNHFFLHADAMKRPLVPTPLAITFLVRRPHHILGVGSDVEICSYVLHVASPEDVLEPDRAKIRYCAVSEQLAVEILRRASGADETSARKPWTLVGCGSVGSKIAVHSARRGFGPSLVVDKSHLQPHNYGRHALLPFSAGPPVGQNKASALRDVLSAFRQPAEAKVADAVAMLAGEGGCERLAAAGAGILNTTASLVIRDQLAFADWKQRPPIGEAHLLGAGRAAYAAFEGAAGNPNLSDLAAESYRLIAADPELREIVFDAEARPITIGQGCSALTFPMPDDQLSALTAGLSRILAQRDFPDARDAGEIRLGKLAGDGLSQSWSCGTIDPWTVVPDRAGGDIAIRISPRVDHLIREEAARRPGSETGGVIVGRFSHIGNAFHVVDVLPAPPDSKFSAHEFVLGTHGLKAAIRRLKRDTGNSLQVLGTWHNHLVKTGPSGLDTRTAATLALSQHMPVLLLIALPEGYTGLVAEAFKSADFMSDENAKTPEMAS